MNKLTKIAVFLVVGFNLALASDSVHAMGIEQMKVCKGVAIEYNDPDIKEHFKARLSLAGIHGTRQNGYVSTAKQISTSTAVNLLTVCGMELRAFNRSSRSATIGDLKSN